jgi:hypothetical protein
MTSWGSSRGGCRLRGRGRGRGRAGGRRGEYGSSGLACDAGGSAAEVARVGGAVAGPG